MRQFRFVHTSIPDLLVVYPFFSEDDRGYFLKSYEKTIFLKNGIETDIFEDFESYSHKGVIRGLHFQSKNPQSKLVRAVSGRVFDVAVDLRQDSPTFGKWEGVYLDSNEHNALFVPKGFAHGFLVTSDNALVSYKCSGEYLKEHDTGIRWDDPDIAIKWPTEHVGKVIVSERDVSLPYFKDCKI